MATPRLKNKYTEEIVPALTKEFGYKNVMQVPRLLKISLSQGLGSAVADKKLVENAMVEMSTIAGQKAVTTKSKKDISNFKLRENMPIGVRVTLRGEKMYEFMDRLINIALPRIKDFRGLSPAGIDNSNNYAGAIGPDAVGGAQCQIKTSVSSITTFSNGFDKIPASGPSCSNSPRTTASLALWLAPEYLRSLRCLIHTIAIFRLICERYFTCGKEASMNSLNFRILAFLC